MDEFGATLHRTWVQLLADHDYKDIAAIAVDSEITVLYNNDYNNYYNPCGLAISIPTSWFGTVKNNDRIKKIMDKALKSVANGNIYYGNGNTVDIEDMEIIYRVKLIEAENGWQNIVKSLIANSNDPNQGIVTEKAFSRKDRQPYIYNEMKFGSQSEIRIAQELEARKVLFFPLPLAVRAETGNYYKDHREVDFLICHNGLWGIIEVSYHPGRYEQDSEKSSWFQKSGILCIKHYTAERCHQKPAEVVAEFLEILEKHK